MRRFYNNFFFLLHELDWILWKKLMRRFIWIAHICYHIEAATYRFASYLLWLSPARALPLKSFLHCMKEQRRSLPCKYLLITLFMLLSKLLSLCRNNVHTAARCSKNSISSFAVSTHRQRSGLLLTCCWSFSFLHRPQTSGTNQRCFMF